MNLVDKQSFLDFQLCRKKGWLARNRKPKLTSAALLRISDGIKVGERARELFPGGVTIGGESLQESMRRTKEVMSNSSVHVLLEAAFVAGSYVAKADVIQRDADGWHLIEVKSGTRDKKEYIQDIAYTKSVMQKSGFNVMRTSLLLISKDFRVGMANSEFFRMVEVSEKVNQNSLNLRFNQAHEILSEECPDPELVLHCRNCKFWDSCLGKNSDEAHSVLELPRLSTKKFEEITSAGIREIAQIRDVSILSARQLVVWRSVVSQEPVIDKKLAAEMLSKIEFPAKYLDFETAASAFPLYPGVSPFEQIPTQFSVHICTSPGESIGHLSYLAENPERDCRLDLAHSLLDALGDAGSIVVYSGFEHRVITGLAKHFPQLEGPLLSLTERLFDFEKVFLKAIYHPAFRGRTSIKNTANALIDQLEYQNLDISDGQSAAAAFALLARGEIKDAAERERTRSNLLEYCALDSFAMVLIHQRVLELIE